MQQRNRYALLSVYHKPPEVKLFAEQLVALGGWTILASGGTYDFLQESPHLDIASTLQSVQALTGSQPMLNHQVVTLHPIIHGGLLVQPHERKEWEKRGYVYIDLFYSTLYPLEETIQSSPNDPEAVRLKRDIGGPAALTSAAKGRRIIVTNTEEAASTLDWIQKGEPNPERRRLICAANAERIVADYAALSAAYLTEQVRERSHTGLS